MSPGLGLTNDVVVDQHFRQRGRLGRLLAALSYNPRLIGIGLDVYVTERIAVETQPYACMLGGADRRTLFICTAAASHPDLCRERRSGRIESVRVEVPGAGLP